MSGNSPTACAGKWATTHESALRGIPTASRLSRRILLSATAHFHLSRSRQETRLVSLRGAGDLRISGLNDVFPSPDGPKIWLNQRYGEIDACSFELAPRLRPIRRCCPFTALPRADISWSHNPRLPASCVTLNTINTKLFAVSFVYDHITGKTYIHSYTHLQET